MNARENNNLASEVITDLTKNLVMMDDKIQGLYGEICEVKSMFQAVHYATVVEKFLGEFWVFIFHIICNRDFCKPQGNKVKTQRIYGI